MYLHTHTYNIIYIFFFFDYNNKKNMSINTNDARIIFIQQSLDNISVIVPVHVLVMLEQLQTLTPGTNTYISTSAQFDNAMDQYRRSVVNPMLHIINYIVHELSNDPTLPSVPTQFIVSELNSVYNKLDTYKRPLGSNMLLKNSVDILKHIRSEISINPNYLAFRKYFIIFNKFVKKLKAFARGAEQNPFLVSSSNNSNFYASSNRINNYNIMNSGTHLYTEDDNVSF